MRRKILVLNAALLAACVTVQLNVAMSIKYLALPGSCSFVVVAIVGPVTWWLRYHALEKVRRATTSELPKDRPFGVLMFPLVVMAGWLALSAVHQSVLDSQPARVVSAHITEFSRSHGQAHGVWQVDGTTYSGGLPFKRSDFVGPPPDALPISVVAAQPDVIITPLDGHWAAPILLVGLPGLAVFALCWLRDARRLTRRLRAIASGLLI